MELASKLTVFSKHIMMLIMFFALLIISGVVYLFIANSINYHRPKTVTVMVNGLATNYATSKPTVGELIAQIYPDSQIVLNIFPSVNKRLANQDIIFVTLKPSPVNKLVSKNLNLAIAASAPPKPKSPTYQGLATWYSFGNEMTAASTQFPKGTKLRVVAVNSGKTIDVVINDYGPAKWTGIALDLNRPAFAKLAPLGAGKIMIKYFMI